MADVEGFLSYAHLDDEFGEITEFKRALENMVSRLRGTPFMLFQDLDSLRTGDLWEKKIEAGLEEASVLVTILTPTFFNRPWCRHEVERFLELKAAQGRPAIVIPIYWLRTPVMERPELLKDHPIAQILAAVQYYNWTGHFGASLTSSPLRLALKEVAEDLINQLETASVSVSPVVIPPVVKATPKVTPRPKARVARLEITHAPVEAQLIVNGIAVVGLTYEVTLPTGEHEHLAEVVVSAPGFRSEEWDVVLVEDHTATIEAPLKPHAAPRVTPRKPVFTAPMTLEEYKAQLQPIPGGSFKRDPRSFTFTNNTITLTPFHMGRTPVTVGMWQEFAKATRNGEMPKLPESSVWIKGWDAVREHPIVRVSWDDCKAYANWAGLVLPTEAQWEYAARGGLEGKLYPWGNHEPNDQLCWTPTSGNNGTVSVERIKNVFVNGYGLVDMAGNVWEWCADWSGEYEGGNLTNPTGASSGEARILRGGSWCSDDSNKMCCAYRYWINPTFKNYDWGFRLCSSPEP
jgi:formylglycine-generating enzyme required for sulfatase activity